MAQDFAILSTLLCLTCIFLTTNASDTSFENPKPITLQAKIMHWNAKISPLHDPTATEDDIFEKDVAISRKQAGYYFGSRSGKSIESIQSNDEMIERSFIMHFKIGTPAIETYAYINTGSSLSWVQCAPCSSCYKQFGSVYNSNKSSSYQNMPWEHRMCSLSAIGGTVVNIQNKCSYSVTYNDRTISGGYIGEETFTFEDDQIVKGVIFGCSNFNIRRDYKPPGLIGLGKLSASLVRQMSASHFSYYVEYNEASSNMVGILDIGTPAIDRRASIPLLPSEDEFYTLQWRNIRVDNESIDVSSTFFESGIVIDSGSTFTLLPKCVLDSLTAAIIEKMGEPLTDYMPRICYRSVQNAPSVNFDFVSYNMSLCQSNIWRQTDGNTYCLAIHESPHTTGSIFGMYQQTNKKIAFDLVRGQVSMIDINNTCPVVKLNE